MTPDELEVRLKALFGPDMTERKAAAALRVTPSAVGRWLRGERKVPGPVIAWLELREQFQELVRSIGYINTAQPPNPPILRG